MRSNKAHRAADKISELLMAHISEESSDIDIHDAIAVRDDIREMAEELESGDKYELPEVGDVLHDPLSNPKFGSNDVEIVEVMENSEARTTYIERDTGKRSVAYLNPTEPEDAPVVVGKYVDGSDKAYRFPVTRLE